MRETLFGFVFILTSGLMYTIERAAAWVAWGSIWSGYQTGGGPVPPDKPTMPGIGDNGFVLFFLLVGLALVVVGLVRGRGSLEDTGREVTEGH